MSTSAVSRLQLLPDFFRGADLTIRFQWTSKTASQYLYLWKKRGLVAALGGHTDVYANLLRNQNPQWEKALRASMPTSTVIGIEALRRAGWTTQIPQRPVVAVNVSQSVFTVDSFEIVARDAVWFENVQYAVVHENSSDLPVLRPAWSLADMLRVRGWNGSGLDPDDIDWDQVNDDDECEWTKACRFFGLPTLKLGLHQQEL